MACGSPIAGLFDSPSYRPCWAASGVASKSIQKHALMNTQSYSKPGRGLESSGRVLSFRLFTAGELEGEQPEEDHRDEQGNPQERLLRAGLGGETRAGAVVKVGSQFVGAGVLTPDRQNDVPHSCQFVLRRLIIRIAEQ